MRVLGGLGLNYSIQLARQMATRSDSNKNIKSFVFMDLETTGLPNEENNTTKITELCLVAVQADHLSLGALPRIQNKLNLCFDPRKLINPLAMAVTGLTNHLLQCQSYFDLNAFNAIKSFIEHLQKPVCLVAHNGNRFDFPILRAEVAKLGTDLPSDLLCIDSLVAFRDLYSAENYVQTSKAVNNSSDIPMELQDGYDMILCSVLESFERKCEAQTQVLTPEEIQKKNETTPKKNQGRIATRSCAEPSTLHHVIGAPKKAKFGRPFKSFKLVDVYTRLTSKQPVSAHQAECDVNMLLDCAVALEDDFIDWSNTNAKRLCDVPAMCPGKTIGM